MEGHGGLDLKRDYMPVTVNAARLVTDQAELFRIEIDCHWNGSAYVIDRVVRHRQTVSRDGNAVEAGRSPGVDSTGYAISDFPGAVQTGLTNFVNALDAKP